GAGNPDAKSALETLRPDTVTRGAPKSIDDATAVLSALWLWHDWLDESHRLSQSLDTVSGSMWHAIMHRREGDFSNSQYWYARCQNHPILPTLAAQASDVINPFPADKSMLKIVHRGWDSDAF